MTLPGSPEIEIPLLKEILAAGGEAKPEDIYLRLSRHFPEVTERDLIAEMPSGSNTWKTRIRFARKDLVDKGELYPGPRGLWRLTPKGEARAKRATQ